MQDVYKNTKEYNSRKKRKVLIVFDDMITDTINKKTKSNNTELFNAADKLIFQLLLLHNHILKYQKKLD